MSTLKHHIDQQIHHNQGKNLFHGDLHKLMKFSEITIENLQNLKELEPEQKDSLVDYSTEKALQEFCRINQYFAFNENDKQELKSIYLKLIDTILDKSISIEEIAGNHYENLKHWLATTNPFVQELYPENDSILEPVACSEYKAELQLEVLNIELNQLSGPILDIGCGTQGNLVKYLSEKGFNVHGIDRFAGSFPDIEEVDWLEYEYGTKTWGTIISNLGFSNHFRHHHLRGDGNFAGYAKKYMEILGSLKIGGCFYYAPDLPFIEKYLGKEYEVKNYTIRDIGICGTRIKRLR